MNRSIKRTVLASMFLLAVAGCSSSGLSAHDETAATYPRMMLYVSPEAALRNGPAIVKCPIRVAVGQVGEIAPPQSMMDELRSKPDLFARVEPVSIVELNESTNISSRFHNDQPDLTAQVPRLRGMATGMGMDYILVFGGIVDHGHQATGLSLLDITVLGAFVIPSNGVAVSGKAAGSLIDAHTGQIVFNCAVKPKDTVFHLPPSRRLSKSPPRS